MINWIDFSVVQSFDGIQSMIQGFVDINLPNLDVKCFEMPKFHQEQRRSLFFDPYLGTIFEFDVCFNRLITTKSDSIWA